MLTIIILTAIAIITLLIGFFEVRLPLINRKNPEVEKNNKLAKDSAKSIESFYRTVRAESWLSNIEQRRASNVA